MQDKPSALRVQCRTTVTWLWMMKCNLRAKKEL